MHRVLRKTQRDLGAGTWRNAGACDCNDFSTRAREERQVHNRVMSAKLDEVYACTSGTDGFDDTVGWTNAEKRLATLRDAEHWCLDQVHRRGADKPRHE